MQRVQRVECRGWSAEGGVQRLQRLQRLGTGPLRLAGNYTGEHPGVLGTGPRLLDRLESLGRGAASLRVALGKDLPRPRPPRTRYRAALEAVGVLGVDVAEVVHAPDERQARGDQHRDRYSPESFEHLYE